MTVPRHARVGIAGLAMLAGLLAWGLLELGHIPLPMHGDMAEDLLLALSCQRGECPTAGVSTTIDGVEQGALWVNLLGLLRGWGLDVDTIHSLTFALGGAAVGLWFAIVALERGRAQAVAAAALLAAALVASRSFHVLWNPSLMALPPVLLYGLLLRLVRDPRLGSAVAVGAACALVVESHPVGVLVVPGALLCLSMLLPGRGRAGVALLGAAALGGLVYFGTSWDAATANLEAAQGRLSSVGLVGTVAGGLLLCGLLARRASGWSVPRRQWLIVASAVLPPLVAVAWMLATIDESPAGPRYLLPALPAATLVPLLLFATWPRLLVGVSIAAAGYSLTTRPPVHAVSLAALDVVREDLEARGMSLDELWVRSSGPSCRSALQNLAALGLARSEPELFPPEDIYLFFLAGARIDAVETDLATTHGQWHALPVPGGVVALGQVDTWVDRRHGELCALAKGGASHGCAPFDLDIGIEALRQPEAGPVPLGQLNVVEMSRFETLIPRDAHAFQMRLPVELEAGTEARRIAIDRARTEPCVRQQFVALEGLDSPTPLPATHLELRRSTHAQRGVLVFERDVSACAAERLHLFPPCLIEAEVDGAPWLDRYLARSIQGFAAAREQTEQRD